VSTTIRKCFTVLERLAASDQPRGISELAVELGMNKSAVQRVFQALAASGYVEKAGARYRPTLRLWELGAAVIGRHETHQALHPILRNGAKVSGLTVYFALADFPWMLYLDKIEGERGRRNSSEPGQRVPMLRTASGKAVLAFHGEQAWRALVAPAADLPAMGVFEPVSETDLAAELEAIRRRLYAISESGTVLQVNSIAAPVWGAASQPLGSIALTSDAAALPREDFARVGAIAIGMAEQATRALGGVFPAGSGSAP